MKDLTKLNAVIYKACLRFVEIRKEDETRRSVFNRDKTYSNLMKKVKTEREAVDVTEEEANTIFRNFADKITK